MNLVELSKTTVEKQKIEVTDIKRVNVSHATFYRNTGGRDLYLVQLAKGKGKKRQSVTLSVLSDEPPTAEKALVCAFTTNVFFNREPLYSFLGHRQYNPLAKSTEAAV